MSEKRPIPFGEKRGNDGQSSHCFKALFNGKLWDASTSRKNDPVTVKLKRISGVDETQMGKTLLALEHSQDEGSAGTKGDPDLDISELPMVAVANVLSYLHWKDKMAAVTAIPVWHNHLCTMKAWQALSYHEDASTKAEVRQKVSLCICTYGKYITRIKLAFHYWYPVGRRGRQVLHEIATHCSQLRKLCIADTVWSEQAEFALNRVLENCPKLHDLSLVRPVLAWSDEDDNVITIICKPRHAMKLTKLILTSESLLEHEGPLDILQNFISLHTLKIRRAELSEKLLLHLSQRKLKLLSVFLEEEVEYGTPMIYSSAVWEQVRQNSPNFVLHLVLKNIIVLRSSFPAGAPLTTLVMVDLSASLTKGIVDTITDQYCGTLETFVYTKSCQLDCAKVEDRRLPAALYDLVCGCNNLHTLVYGFQISSTTALMIAKARMLRHYVLLLDDVTFEQDWPVQPDWSAEFLSWLKESGSSLGSLETAVSELLRFPWRMSTHFSMWENVNFFVNLWIEWNKALVDVSLFI